MSASVTDLDERILKQQQEEEERKRQRREKKKEKKVCTLSPQVAYCLYLSNKFIGKKERDAFASC